MQSDTRYYLDRFDNPHDFERMCADILNALGYKDVELMAPRGGPDGGRDITFTTENGEQGLACVTLRKDIKTKFDEDFSQRVAGEYDIYNLFCTAYIPVKQKDDFKSYCANMLKAKFVSRDIEALRSLLDSNPKMKPIKNRWLASISPSTLPVKWNVPFPHNPFFTGRDEELEYLNAQFHRVQTATVSQPQAISGLGGVGKTQIAAEYAHRYHQDYQAVFWVRADSVEALISSYTTLAGLLDLPLKDEREQEIIIQAVKSWLRMHRNWLLILDNANEPDLLPPFLPPVASGHILLTTRVTELGGLGLSIAHPIEIKPFSPQQGACLLLHRAGLLALDSTLDQVAAVNQDLAMQISNELGGLPLALDQAGAYIAAAQTSLTEYLRIYNQYRAELLKERRNREYPESVATTWIVSFERVQARNPAAAELLRFCAFLAPDTIAEEILTGGAQELGPVLSPVVANDYQFNAAIEALRAYSLIIRDRDKHTFTIHRLVQAVLRDSMPTEVGEQWKQRVVMAVNESSPDVQDVTQRDICERWLPHALICATWIEQERIILTEGARLLNQAGYYLVEQGRYTEAEPLYLRSLSIYEEVMGAEHPDVIVSLGNLAELYQKLGRYAEAKPLYTRAFSIAEKALGIEHPDTALAVNNLAGWCWDQGEYEDAKPLMEWALKIRVESLGTGHPDVAQSLSNLGVLYEELGKYEDAEWAMQRALTMTEAHVGVTHPSTALILNNLAALYTTQGRYGEAETMHRRALTIRESKLWAGHPDIAQSLHNLASVCGEQGKYDEQERLLQKALTIFEQNLGIEHPATLASLTNLGLLYLQMGRYIDAEPLLQRALMIREQQLGPENLDVAHSLFSLASLCKRQGKYNEAELLLQRALTIREKYPVPEHPDTVSCFSLLGNIYEDQGKYDDAELLLQRVIAIREKQLGPEHPDMASSLNNLALLYTRQERYGEAEPLLKRALSICEQRLGPEHPNTQIARKNHLAFLSLMKHEEGGD